MVAEAVGSVAMVELTVKEIMEALEAELRHLIAALLQVELEP
jgi:hypothetical protein